MSPRNGNRRNGNQRTIPVTDAGLQPERTSLAWARTSLAMLVCSATLLRWAWHYPAVVFVAVAILAVLAAFIVFTQRARYSREAHGIARERVEPNIESVLAMTLGLAVLGGIGLYLVSVAF
ncbi:DUF202 domain-containing protein [Corynebacterium lubricantis]|uniref:DUF202 domain-containing protein n=1 Tax=Corynebacterium lubricantis TaxID=541095 RepID=UPI000376D27D|nr:DUF202 domain-containing protein [Corynebacterium lubricantis]